MKKHRGTFVFLFVGAKVSKGSIYTNRRGYALYAHYSVQQNYRSTSRSRNTTNLYLYVALELLDTSALTRTDCDCIINSTSLSVSCICTLRWSRLYEYMEAMIMYTTTIVYIYTISSAAFYGDFKKICFKMVLYIFKIFVYYNIRYKINTHCEYNK